MTFFSIAIIATVITKIAFFLYVLLLWKNFMLKFFHFKLLSMSVSTKNLKTITTEKNVLVITQNYRKNSPWKLR